MSEAFFQKHKKKGLVGLLLLLFGGARRDVLLVVMVAVGLALGTGVAAITGHLHLLGRATPATSADGTKLETDAEAQAKADSEKAAGQVFKEVEQAKIEAASSRGVLPVGVPGKAKDRQNDAVNYVGRDKKLIGDAEAQHGIGQASAGKEYGGPELGQGNGMLGQKGSGSLGMAAAGDMGSSNGPTFTIGDNKSNTFDAMKNNIPPMGRNVKFRGGSFDRGGGGGKITGFKSVNLNARIMAGRNSAGVKQGRLGRAMWHLVNAAAQTLTSTCPNCARESSAIYNRAYATGESVSGAGIIALPGDAPVAIDPSKMDAMMKSLGDAAGAVGGVSQACNDATKKDAQDVQELGKKIAGIRWDGSKTLDQQPDKCCKTKDYNDRVNDFKSLCGQYNTKNQEVNQACGTPKDQGGMDCGRYNTVETCGWFKCWFLFILVVALVIGAAFVAPLVFGVALGTIAGVSAGVAAAIGAGLAGAAIVGGFALFAPNELPH